MKIIDDLKGKIDDESADTLFEVYQGAIQRVVLAPYRCMMLSVTSCLLLGSRYKRFVRISTAICLVFITIMSICFLTLRNISYLWYAVGGLLTLLYIITFIHKDTKHLEILKEASLVSDGVIVDNSFKDIPSDLELDGSGESFVNSLEENASFSEEQFQPVVQSEPELKSVVSKGVQRIKLCIQQASDEEDLDDMDDSDDELN